MFIQYEKERYVQITRIEMFLEEQFQNLIEEEDLEGAKTVNYLIHDMKTFLEKLYEKRNIKEINHE